jgi:hypothetical protein
VTIILAITGFEPKTTLKKKNKPVNSKLLSVSPFKCTHLDFVYACLAGAFYGSVNVY